jgi:GNAT superfamily N-acetyltransferase
MDDDLAACEVLAQQVHALDGYPVYLPGDLRSFLASPTAYDAWVAEGDGRVIGHVALHRKSSRAVLALASEATRLPTDRLGVIARLLVSPDHRRRGIGGSLLDVAMRAAQARDLCPILDVVSHHHTAIALYETCGWTKAGSVTVSWDTDVEIEEFVYLAPGIEIQRS